MNNLDGVLIGKLTGDGQVGPDGNHLGQADKSEILRAALDESLRAAREAATAVIFESLRRNGPARY